MSASKKVNPGTDNSPTLIDCPIFNLEISTEINSGKSFAKALAFSLLVTTLNLPPARIPLETPVVLIGNTTFTGVSSETSKKSTCKVWSDTG